MNDAAQIRRCRGALRAERSRSQPPFLSPPPARRPNLKISNRESRHSNREKSHTFQNTINPSTSTTHDRNQLHSQIPNFQPPNKAKSINNHPQSLFRLERTPTLCFQQLTRNLNEPMFRLETKKGGKETKQTGGTVLVGFFCGVGGAADFG
jgi:hypothetical protein